MVVLLLFSDYNEIQDETARKSTRGLYTHDADTPGYSVSCYRTGVHPCPKSLPLIDKTNHKCYNNHLW